MRMDQRIQTIVCQSKGSHIFGKKCAIPEMIDGLHLKSHLNVEVKAFELGIDCGCVCTCSCVLVTSCSIMGPRWLIYPILSYPLD